MKTNAKSDPKIIKISLIPLIIITLDPYSICQKLSIWLLYVNKLSLTALLLFPGITIFARKVRPINLHTLVYN